MARPTKTGLDYFPFNTDFMSNRKISRLMIQFGLEGVMAYIVIVSEAYKNGYHIELDDNLYLDIAYILRTKENRIKEAVSCCIQLGLFNERLAKEYKILTSETIQKNFVIAKRKSRLDIESGHLLIDTEGVFPGKTPVNSGKTPVNPGKSTQNKRKEKKVKENKAEENKREACDTAANAENLLLRNIILNKF